MLAFYVNRNPYLYRVNVYGHGILKSVAMGSRKGKRAAVKLAREKAAGQNVVKAIGKTPPNKS
jgi:hypothetical protein